jgi:hypothetical protein
MAKKKQYSPEFKPGDTARVRGTNRNNWHRWQEGDIVVLDRFDPDDNSWWAHDPRQKHIESWIGAEDIEADFEPVTDEEVAKLFGIGGLF